MSNDYEVDILVNSKPIKKFAHQNQTYIEARKGQEYSIRIKNNSHSRRLFVVTCDGLNVVDGKTGGKTQAGYVLNGYSSYEVSGFRTSNEEVHPFRFNDKQKSYAAKSEETGGDFSNCGVIGIKVFEEKKKPVPTIIEKYIHHHHREKEYVPYVPVEPPYRPWRRSPIWYYDDLTSSGEISGGGNYFGGISNATYSANSSSMSRSSDLGQVRCSNLASYSAQDAYVQDCEEDSKFNAGTEFSKHAVSDAVTDTTFDIDKLLVTIEIFYAYRNDLVEMGVPVNKEIKVSRPQAFPSNFCKPPRG